MRPQRRSRRTRNKPPEIVPPKSDEENAVRQPGDEEMAGDGDDEVEAATAKSEASETSQKGASRKSKRARKPTARSKAAASTFRERRRASSPENNTEDSSGESDDDGEPQRRRKKQWEDASDREEDEGSSDENQHSEAGGSNKSQSSKTSESEDEDEDESSESSDDDEPLSSIKKRKEQQREKAKSENVSISEDGSKKPRKRKKPSKASGDEEEASPKRTAARRKGRPIDRPKKEDPADDEGSPSENHESGGEGSVEPDDPGKSQPASGGEGDSHVVLSQVSENSSKRRTREPKKSLRNSGDENVTEDEHQKQGRKPRTPTKKEQPKSAESSGKDESSDEGNQDDKNDQESSNRGPKNSADDANENEDVVAEEDKSSKLTPKRRNTRRAAPQTEIQDEEEVLAEGDKEGEDERAADQAGRKEIEPRSRSNSVGTNESANDGDASAEDKMSEAESSRGSRRSRRQRRKPRKLGDEITSDEGDDSMKGVQEGPQENPATDKGAQEKLSPIEVGDDGGDADRSNDEPQNIELRSQQDEIYQNKADDSPSDPKNADESDDENSNKVDQAEGDPSVDELMTEASEVAPSDPRGPSTPPQDILAEPDSPQVFTNSVPKEVEENPKSGTADSANNQSSANPKASDVAIHESPAIKSNEKDSPESQAEAMDAEDKRPPIIESNENDSPQSQAEAMDINNQVSGAIKLEKKDSPKSPAEAMDVENKGPPKIESNMNDSPEAPAGEVFEVENQEFHAIVSNEVDSPESQTEATAGQTQESTAIESNEKDSPVSQTEEIDAENQGSSAVESNEMDTPKSQAEVTAVQNQGPLAIESNENDSAEFQTKEIEVEKQESPAIESNEKDSQAEEMDLDNTGPAKIESNENGSPEATGEAMEAENQGFPAIESIEMNSPESQAKAIDVESKGSPVLASIANDSPESQVEAKDVEIKGPLTTESNKMDSPESQAEAMDVENKGLPKIESNETDSPKSPAEATDVENKGPPKIELNENNYLEAQAEATGVANQRSSAIESNENNPPETPGEAMMEEENQGSPTIELNEKDSCESQAESKDVGNQGSPAIESNETDYPESQAESMDVENKGSPAIESNKIASRESQTEATEVENKRPPALESKEKDSPESQTGPIDVEKQGSLVVESNEENSPELDPRIAPPSNITEPQEATAENESKIDKSIGPLSKEDATQDLDDSQRSDAGHVLADSLAQVDEPKTADPSKIPSAESDSRETASFATGAGETKEFGEGPEGTLQDDGKTPKLDTIDNSTKPTTATSRMTVSPEQQRDGASENGHQRQATTSGNAENRRRHSVDQSAESHNPSKTAETDISSVDFTAFSQLGQPPIETGSLETSATPQQEVDDESKNVPESSTKTEEHQRENAVESLETDSGSSSAHDQETQPQITRKKVDCEARSENLSETECKLAVDNTKEAGQGPGPHNGDVKIADIVETQTERQDGADMVDATELREKPVANDLSRQENAQTDLSEILPNAEETFVEAKSGRRSGEAEQAAEVAQPCSSNGPSMILQKADQLSMSAAIGTERHESSKRVEESDDDTDQFHDAHMELPSEPPSPAGPIFLSDKNSVVKSGLAADGETDDVSQQLSYDAREQPENTGSSNLPLGDEEVAKEDDVESGQESEAIHLPKKAEGLASTGNSAMPLVAESTQAASSEAPIVFGVEKDEEKAPALAEEEIRGLSKKVEPDASGAVPMNERKRQRADEGSESADKQKFPRVETTAVDLRSGVGSVAKSKLSPPNGIVKRKGALGRPGRSKLNRAKTLLYSTGSRVHRGRGFERIFAEYWDAVSLRLSDRLSCHTSERCDHAVKAFLKSPRLRKLHNKFIMSIMKQAYSSSAPYHEILKHIPSKWHGRVTTMKSTLEVGADLLPIASSSEQTMIANAPMIANEPIYRRAWEDTVDQVNPILSSLNPEMELGGHRMDSTSAWIPGALIVDPLVRETAQKSGMRVSEHAIWLLVVAVKEHTTNILKGAVSHHETLEEGQIPSRALRYPNVLANSKNTSKRGKQQEEVVEKPKVEIQVEATKRLSVFDIYGGSNIMPSRSIGSLGGAVSRSALERCLQSSFDTLPSLPGIGFVQVQKYVSAEIAVLAHKRKLEPKEVAPRERANRTAVMASKPQSASAQQQEVKVTLAPVALVVAPAQPSEHVPQSAKIASTAPVEAMTQEEMQESLRPSIRGLGRGAKNLAALMKRAATSSPRAQPEGTPTDTPINAEPTSQGTPTEQSKPDVSSDSRPAGPTATSASTENPPENETTAPEPTDETMEDELDGQGQQRRGKGFGTKNLAAMRARASTKKTKPNPAVVDLASKGTTGGASQTVVNTAAPNASVGTATGPKNASDKPAGQAQST